MVQEVAVSVPWSARVGTDAATPVEQEVLRVRVALLTNLFPPDVLGGYEVIAADLAMVLRSRGHDVQVLTTGEPRGSDPEWVHREWSLVRPFGTPCGTERIAHMRRARCLRRSTARLLGRGRGFDVALICSLRRVGLAPAKTAQAAGLPLVWAFNDEWLLGFRPGGGGRARRAWALLERLVPPMGARSWRGLDVRRALYIAGPLQRRHALHGLPPGRITPQGVDLERFAYRSPRAAMSPPRLLFVGRLARDKGPDAALAAQRCLREGGIASTLTIVGSGEMRASLEAAAPPGTSFAGFRPRAELPELYRAHDIFLFPCRWEEPSGLTWVEAMASGLPVVAEARGGAAEGLRDRAYVVPEDATGAAIARAVRQILRAPGDARRQAEANRRQLEVEGGLAGYVNEVEEELRDACGRDC